MIGIIDYGMGNIHSVAKALESLGGKTIVVNAPEELKNCDKLVLPGVGAFDDAVSELERKGLIDPLKEYIADKKVFLGICLGMQLLFSESQEAISKTGLGVLKGSVVRFQAKGLKVPQMGWNQLKVENKSCPLLQGIEDKEYVYFCHSYYPQPDEQKVVAASTDYGVKFSSIVWQENIFGVQFHPEKSQDTGIRILKNFVGL